MELSWDAGYTAMLHLCIAMEFMRRLMHLSESYARKKSTHGAVWCLHHVNSGERFLWEAKNMLRPIIAWKIYAFMDNVDSAMLVEKDVYVLVRPHNPILCTRLKTIKFSSMRGRPFNGPWQLTTEVYSRLTKHSKYSGLGFWLVHKFLQMRKPRRMKYLLLTI